MVTVVLPVPACGVTDVSQAGFGLGSVIVQAAEQVTVKVAVCPAEYSISTLSTESVTGASVGVGVGVGVGGVGVGVIDEPPPPQETNDNDVTTAIAKICKALICLKIGFISN